MKAALLTGINQPLSIEEIEWREPGPGQVLLSILVSGICGKQIGEIAGTQDVNAPIPRLLGHEACGIVEITGPGVTKVKRGDKCVLHWRKGSGAESSFPAYRRGSMEYNAGKITTFSDTTVVSENRLTPVPHETPNELCALLGCGLSTALGVMENEARLRAGESVLIVGCGGVGLNLIRVARMMGASKIVGLDKIVKPETIQGAGADYARFGLAVEKSQFDVIVDTSGYSDPFSESLRLLAPSGRMILVGQPKEAESFVITCARHLFDGEGKTIKATQGGGFNPDRDIPRYVKMWQSNHLKIDGIITNRFPLDQINDALDLVRSGNAGRVMLEVV